MKNTILMSTFLFITLSGSVLAQDTNKIIEKFMSKYQLELEKKLETDEFQQQNLASKEKIYQTDLKKKSEIEHNLEKLEVSKHNYDESIAALKIYAQNERDHLPFLQKIASKKKSFYSCLIEGIEKSNFPNIKSCEANHSAKFSTKEKMMLKNYNMFLSKPKSELDNEIGRLSSDLKRVESQIVYSKKSFDSAKEWAEISKNNLDSLYSKMDEIDKLKVNEPFFNCGPSMKELDLENEHIYEGSQKKGPFFGVRRDNQDGVGTCFANAAKNLLVSLSGGEMVGSFLDMALQYKKIKGAYLVDGIDGGGSCETLNQIRKNGFCDQKYSPAETGEKNTFLEGLITSENASVDSQGKMIDKVREFLQAKKSLDSIDPKYSKAFLKDPRTLVEKMKNDPDIVFPLPIVNDTPAQNWQTNQAFYVANKDPSDEKLKEFKQDVIDLDKKIQSKLIQAVLNDKSIDEFTGIYSKPFKALLAKWGMSSSYDQIMKFYLSDFKRTFTEENKRKLFKSVRFLQTITNSDSVPAPSFAASCIEAFEKGFDFMNKLNPLVRDIAAINASSDVLVDGEKFKEGAELLQLAIAPTCLNEKNRTKIDFEFSCGNGVETSNEIKTNFVGDERLKAYRMKVVNNLLQGYAIGHELSTKGESSANHINTIVGLRYNPTLDRCEYKVRESQNGKSEWHDESYIVGNTLGFIEVRKL